jgi:hypothetical protein
MLLPPDKIWSCCLRRVVSLLLLATIMSSAQRAVADETSRAAEMFLRRDRGLRRLSPGDVWLATSEYLVRDKLAGLDDSRRQVIQRQRELDERSRQNRAAWAASQRQIAVLRGVLASSDTNESEKRRIRQQIEDWKSRAIDPTKLAAEPDVRSLLIQLMNERDRLALALIALRRLIPQIHLDYQRLSEDAQVQAALRQLGRTHRLGPLADDYEKQLRRLPDYEQLVFTPWVPVYLYGERVRVGLLVNESTPVTFTWRDSNDPLIIPDSMAEAVGIERAEGGERAVPIQLGPGRRVEARLRTVATIRLGQYLLREVPCLVLPPEAEDVGAQIGIDAWSEYDAKVELQRFRLLLRPR